MAAKEDGFLAAREAQWTAMEALGIPTVRMRNEAQKLGAAEAARRCLSGRRCSDGFDRLAQAGQLKLSLEALALEPAWGSLFTDDQANEAVARLMEAGYDFLRK